MDKGEQDILNFINDNFSPDRSQLINKLREFEYLGGRFDKVFEQIELLERPFDSYTGQTDNNLDNVNCSTPNLEDIGDISDCYIILLNQELNDENFDIEEEHDGSDYEFRFVKFWVNWFIPVYHLQTIYDKYCEDGKRLIIGQHQNLTQYELEIVTRIKKIIEGLGFQEIKEPLIHQKILNTQTDCSDEHGATVFECLFSDAITDYPYRLSKNIQPLQSKEDNNSYFEPAIGQTYFIVRETFDQNDTIIEREEIELTKSEKKKLVTKDK